MNNRVMIIVLLVTVMVSLITGLALAETSPAVFVNSSPAARQDSLAAEPLFTETGIELPYVWQGSTAWGDYDRDGDLDIVLTSGYLTSAVFRNDGDDQFTDINAGLETVNGCSAAWGDYDNDGDLDLLLVGENANGLHSKIYRNDGSDTFTDIQANITGVWGFSRNYLGRSRQRWGPGFFDFRSCQYRFWSSHYEDLSQRGA
jgi:hypothetical protein